MASTIQINRIVFIIKGGGYCRLTVRGRFVVLIGEKKIDGSTNLKYSHSMGT